MAKSLKILHVCPLYYPSIGGNQSHLQALSEAMAQESHDVHVFTAAALQPSDYNTAQAPSTLRPFEIINRVSVHRFKIDLQFRQWLFEKLPLMRGGYRFTQHFFKENKFFFEIGPFTPSMLSAIGRLRPNIILSSHNAYFPTYLCYWARKLFKIPWINMPITHQSEFFQSTPIQNKLFAQADGIVACTEYEKKLLIQRGTQDKKITVLPLGINPEPILGGDSLYLQNKFNLTAKPTFAYVGRLVPLKGIEHFIDAMHGVWREFPDCQVLLAGQPDPSFAPILEKHIGQHTAENRKKIFRVEKFTEDEKKHIYASIDALVMPSNIDCFGIVYLEAWAQKKPVIACRHTPQETIISHKHDGLLVNYGETNELTQAMLSLAMSADYRKQLGENGWQSLQQKHLLKNYAHRFIDYYRQHLATKPGFLRNFS